MGAIAGSWQPEGNMLVVVLPLYRIGLGLNQGPAASDCTH